MIGTPEQVIQGYQDGSIVGSIRDPRHLAEFLAELDTPFFGAAAWELTGSGSGKIALPFKAALELDAEFGKYEAQTTGDCVSHATRNAGYVDHCVDVVTERVKYAGRFATENIYGMRGHGGQGASCSRLAKYIWEQGVGGFLPRKRYEDPNGRGSVDLSRYNSRIGHNWGRGGTPDWLNKIADESPAEHVAMITQLEEARDAIANGYSVSVCSGHGFSNRRGEYGIAKRASGWNHAMAWVGFIDDKNDPGYKAASGPLVLIQNSWGVWNSGPTYLGQPAGSFWISWRDATAMLAARGAWVIGRTKFARRKLPEYMLI